MMDINRSDAAPESLAEGHSWSGDDVKQQLFEDFSGKCYLTETVFPSPASIEVDHFQPRNQFHEKKYDWSNLFPATHDANSRRPKKWPDGGLLDPSTNETVEDRLQQWVVLDAADCKPYFTASAADDIAAVNTAKQLDHLHNHKNLKAKDLRDSIVRYLASVLTKCVELNACGNHGECARLETELRQMLSRNAPYTMLVRSFVSKIDNELTALFD